MKYDPLNDAYITDSGKTIYAERVRKPWVHDHDIIVKKQLPRKNLSSMISELLKKRGSTRKVDNVSHEEET